MNISYRIELPCKVKDKYNELTFVNLVELTAACHNLLYHSVVIALP